MLKKAFTMVELVIALFVVAVVAAVTVGIAKNKMERIDKYTYYIGYSIVQDFSANIMSQFKYAKVDIENEEPSESTCSENGYIYNEMDKTCVEPKTAENLCKAVKKKYNISASNCDISADKMKKGVEAGFSAQDPHIKMANGALIYIATDMTKQSAISDSESKNDRVGYLIYIDVNGPQKGKGVLYQDVFPFYLTMSGKIIPGYKSGVIGGANSPEHLSLNILYDNYSDDVRTVKAEKTNLDFVTAACETGYVTSKKYCGNKSLIDICDDANKDCRYIINKPMKIFR